MYSSGNRQNLFFALFFIVCSALNLSACSTAKAIQESESGSFFKKMFSRDTYRIYKIDIEQGNQITPQQLSRLKPGLTKTQIKYLLGPSVTPTLFHDDRWDYVYSFSSGTSSKREKYRVTLFFIEDKLIEIKKAAMRPE